jgi:transcriptional antiterminator
LFAENKPACIWGIEYGATLTEVESEVKKYNLDYKINNNVLICVNAKVFGEKVRVIGFHFYEDKLYKVIAAVVPDSAEKTFETYRNLSKKLSDKYGNSDYSEEIYTHPFTPIDSVSTKIQALAEEKLTLISKWIFKPAYSMLLTINEKAETVLSYRDEAVDDKVGR